jgi:hypothetical protein
MAASARRPGRARSYTGFSGKKPGRADDRVDRDLPLPRNPRPRGTDRRPRNSSRPASSPIRLVTSLTLGRAAWKAVKNPLHGGPAAGPNAPSRAGRSLRREDDEMFEVRFHPGTSSDLQVVRQVHEPRGTRDGAGDVAARGAPACEGRRAGRRDPDHRRRRACVARTRGAAPRGARRRVPPSRHGREPRARHVPARAPLEGRPARPGRGPARRPGGRGRDGTRRPRPGRDAAAPYAPPSTEAGERSWASISSTRSWASSRWGSTASGAGSR